MQAPPPFSLMTRSPRNDSDEISTCMAQACIFRSITASEKGEQGRRRFPTQRTFKRPASPSATTLTTSLFPTSLFSLFLLVSLGSLRALPLARASVLPLPSLTRPGMWPLSLSPLLPAPLLALVFALASSLVIGSVSAASLVPPPPSFLLSSPPPSDSVPPVLVSDARSNAPLSSSCSEARGSSSCPHALSRRGNYAGFDDPRPGGGQMLTVRVFSLPSILLL